MQLPLLSFCWLVVALTAVQCKNIRKTLAIKGLSLHPWTAGDIVTFDSMWMDQPGFLLKTPLSHLRLSVVREKLGPDSKYRVHHPHYGGEDQEGWFTVSFKLPTSLKAGKCHLLWETKGLGRNKVESKPFDVVSATGSQTYQKAL